MRTFLLLLLSTVLASAQQTPSEFMTTWVDAYNKNDAKKIVSYYDQSEDTDCLISAGLWLRGYKQIKDMYYQDMRDVRFYDSQAEGMKHRTLDNTAVVSFVHKFKYAVREAGVHYRIHIRTTATLRKDKEGWKIVSEHSSAIDGIERAQIIKREQSSAPNLPHAE